MIGGTHGDPVVNSGLAVYDQAGDARHGVDLFGRGSVCINTGGEKVYPEEVEEVLKTLG